MDPDELIKRRELETVVELLRGEIGKRQNETASAINTLIGVVLVILKNQIEGRTMDKDGLMDILHGLAKEAQGQKQNMVAQGLILALKDVHAKPHLSVVPKRPEEDQ